MRGIDWFAVTCLLLFAVALRLIGISYGQLNDDYYPSTAPYDMLHPQVPMQPDEYLSVAVPMDMSLNQRLNPNFYEYPTFIANTNFVLYHLTGVLDGLSIEDRRGENLRLYSDFSLYVMSRMYSVFGGLLMVVCAYAISRIVAGRYVALCAGLLVAVSFTLVQHAHYIKPGTLSTGWMMLATWASIASLYSQHRRHREGLYIIAGAVTGLAGTTRYNALAVGLIILIVGLILLYRHRSKRMVLVMGLSWLLIPSVFFFGSPYILIDFPRFWKDFTYIVGQFTVTGQNVRDYFLVSPMTGLGYMLAYLALFGIGIPAIAYSFIALFSSFANRPQAFFKQNSQTLYIFIITLFVLVYMLVTFRTIRPGHSDNVQILVLPFIALLSAIGAGRLVKKIPLPSTITMPTILLILILQPLILSVQVVEMFTQPDTRHIMTDWVYETIPEGSRFFLNGAYNVPLDPAIYPYEQQFGVYTSGLPSGDEYDYMIYSDALAFDILRSVPMIPLAIRESQIQYVVDLDSQFIRVIEIHRPRWTGSDTMMNMAVYWHNPTLIVYCLNPQSCEAIGA